MSPKKWLIEYEKESGFFRLMGRQQFAAECKETAVIFAIKKLYSLFSHWHITGLNTLNDDEAIYFLARYGVKAPQHKAPAIVDVLAEMYQLDENGTQVQVAGKNQLRPPPE